MEPSSQGEFAIRTRHRSAAREWAIRVGLIMLSVLIALLLAEGLTRVLFPISDRRGNLTLDGKLINTWVAPGTIYRQISNEYDALTTITDKGHRAPAVEGSPELVFIGDSFTFGVGLSDQETFVSLYCARAHRSCANLGVPGSGTLGQVERLEDFIDRYNWRPREVKLFFFGMSGSFSAGNDFVDNYDRRREQAAIAAGETPRRDEPRGGLAERVISMRRLALHYSNLLRMAMYYAGPAMKSMVVADPGERMTLAVEATGKALQRLDELSRRAGFEYKIYLLVPVQDVLRHTHGETLATLSAVSPRPVAPTAQLFADAPSSYYYAFDGHFNPAGSRRIAEFLLTLDNKAVGKVPGS